VTSRRVTSPCEVTSSCPSPLTKDTSELGVRLTVGRRLKHIAMKATFDQPRSRASHLEVKPSEFYASELLGSFIMDQQLQQPAPSAATVVQAVEVQLSTLIVVGSPFSHTVHYINADQLPDDAEQIVSPSSTSDWSSELSTSESSPSDSPNSSSSSSTLHLQSADTLTDISDEPCRLIDVMSPDSGDDFNAADLSDLDELREDDLLPLSLCTESPWYLGMTDDELSFLLTEPVCSTTPAVDIDDLISATELSWPSPSADTSLSCQTVQDYSTPEVIELLGSVYDDWLREDPYITSFFAPT